MYVPNDYDRSLFTSFFPGVSSPEELPLYLLSYMALYFYGFMTPVLPFLAGTPFVQLLLWRPNRRWLSRTAILINFVPAAVATCFWTVFFVRMSEGLSRVSLWGNLTDLDLAGRMFILFWVCATINFAFWSILVWFRDYKKDHSKRNRHPIFAIEIPAAAVLIVTFSCAVYLCNYCTLQEAVVRRDYRMIEKRVQFNLLGVGVDDGWIEWYSGGHFSRSLLGYALGEEDFRLASFLLDKRDGIERVDDEKADEHGRLLLYLIGNGNLDTLKKLIASCADPTTVQGEITELLEDPELPNRSNILTYFEESHPELILSN